jgi:hypothetical protein
MDRSSPKRRARKQVPEVGHCTEITYPIGAGKPDTDAFVDTNDNLRVASFPRTHHISLTDVRKSRLVL